MAAAIAAIALIMASAWRISGISCPRLYGGPVNAVFRRGEVGAACWLLPRQRALVRNTVSLPSPVESGRFRRKAAGHGSNAKRASKDRVGDGFARRLLPPREFSVVVSRA